MLHYAENSIKDWLMFLLQNLEQSTQHDLIDTLTAINHTFLADKLHFTRDNIVITMNRLIKDSVFLIEDKRIIFNTRYTNCWWIRLPDPQGKDTLSFETINQIKIYLATRIPSLD